MTTLTLYRPIGTVEAALIERAGWHSFPAMPSGFGFYAYAQPVADPRDWPAQVADIEWFEALEYGQEEVVLSWQAWGNAPEEYFVVWFDVDEKLCPRLHVPLDVETVNQNLIGPIQVCARYSPSEVWIHPRLRDAIA
ncbi:hypothetical protein [Sphingomonas sp. NFR04]|uniref:hypothetical protein n=1 Tax=Sphingomonas sp. NFR04 TaxID=1566283 RepID=UPI00111431E7|nr:hypothetical protein [Sphingomonas sp. NFR04]